RDVGQPGRRNLVEAVDTEARAVAPEREGVLLRREALALAAPAIEFEALVAHGILPWAEEPRASVMAAAALDQLTHLALLPVMRRPGQHLVGVQAVQEDEHAPADERRIEPGRPGRRGIDQEQHEIDDHIGGEMAVEAAQRAHPAPRPLLDLGRMRSVPCADARSQLDWLAALATHYWAASVLMLRRRSKRSATL